MKKKIKDLTYDEVVDLCVNYKDCKGCPLSVGNFCLGSKKIIEKLNEEIEVEKND